MLDDCFLQVDQVCRFQRVRLVVGECAVEFEIQRDDFDRQLGEPGRGAEDRGHSEPAHAVSGIHHHAQWANVAQINEFAQVTGIAGQNVEGAERARNGRRNDAGVEVRGRTIPNAGKPGLQADALSSGARKLDAVVGGRVVARGEHRGRCVQNAGGVIGFVSRTEPDGDDIGSANLGAASESGGELRGGVPHVVTDDNFEPRGIRVVAHKFINESCGERLNNFGGKLATNQASNVIGFHKIGEVASVRSHVSKVT